MPDVSKVRLVDGPHDGFVLSVPFLGPDLVAPFGATGEVVYRLDFSDPEALEAHFVGFRQADSDA